MTIYKVLVEGLDKTRDQGTHISLHPRPQFQFNLKLYMSVTHNVNLPYTAQLTSNSTLIFKLPSFSPSFLTLFNVGFCTGPSRLLRSIPGPALGTL